MREAWQYHRRKIYFLLLAVSFVLGVHGMYVYYRPIISKDWQLLSAMLYGTMKLYLFSPPLGVTDKVTIGYEIAKWLAPMLTSALVLTALTNRFLHLKNTIINWFGRHVLVLGASDESLTFLKNLRSTKPTYRVSLLSLKPLSDDELQSYERLGVAVYLPDPRSLSVKEKAALAKQVRLNSSDHLVFLSNDETVNYQVLLSLLDGLKPNGELKVHLSLESPVLINYVSRALERRTAADSGLEKIDVNFFSPAGLTMERLLGRGGAVQFVEPMLDKLSPGDNPLEKLEQVHLFILGLNEYSLELIRRSVNDFVVGRERVQVTLVDSGAESFADDFWFSHPELNQALEIDFVSSLPGKRSFVDVAKGSFSALFLNHPDPLVNLSALEYFPSDLPIAFRNQSQLNLNELKTSHPRLIMYGNLSDILTREIVLQESLDQAARRFNARYDEVATVLGGGGSPWEKLSPTKKASSRLSATHSFIKEALLTKYLGQDEAEIKRTLTEDQAEFNELVRTTQGEAFRSGLTDLFNRKPYLQFLSELEHQRWCHSYYAMGYVKGDVKNEALKTHPCLDCSWDWLMDEAFFQCHPEYDLISALSLFGNQDETK